MSVVSVERYRIDRASHEGQCDECREPQFIGEWAYDIDHGGVSVCSPACRDAVVAKLEEYAASVRAATGYEEGQEWR